MPCLKSAGASTCQISVSMASNWQKAKRLKDLELENSRLKKLLAEAHLDIEALKVVARGKG